MRNPSADGPSREAVLPATLLSGGVESGHAGHCLTDGIGQIATVARQRKMQSGSSAPPAQNNLPVPVLAELNRNGATAMKSFAYGDGVDEARESAENCDHKGGCAHGSSMVDSRGGQIHFIYRKAAAV